MALSMTCGVTMYYYAQHTRQVTDGQRVCERSRGAAAPLAAARAVNELRPARPRLAQAHTKCAINTNSATMVTKFNGCDKKLMRSINNYRCRYKVREGVFKGGYPFMFISPFDIKLNKHNNQGRKPYRCGKRPHKLF